MKSKTKVAKLNPVLAVKAFHRRAYTVATRRDGVVRFFCWSTTEPGSVLLGSGETAQAAWADAASKMDPQGSSSV